MCRVWNDPDEHDQLFSEPQTLATAIQAALRTALVVEAPAVLHAYGNDDVLRPLHMLANLMLGLWIGACMASERPSCCSSMRG